MPPSWITKLFGWISLRSPRSVRRRQRRQEKWPWSWHRPCLEHLEDRTLLSVALDNFTGYAAGELDGNAGGYGWMGAWQASEPETTVVNGNLGAVSLMQSESPFVQLTINGALRAAARTLAQPMADQAAIYISALVQPNLNAGGIDASTTGGISLYSGNQLQFQIGENLASPNWGIKVPGGAISDSTIAINSSTPTLLVARIDQADKTLTLWVNPNLLLPESANTPAVSRNYDPNVADDFDSVSLSARCPDGTWSFDNLQINSDFSPFSQPSGQTDFVGQGPTMTTGGQVMGMDNQGNPVAGAIQAVAVNPLNADQVFVGTVNGGVWRTDDINATQNINGHNVPFPTWTPLTDQFPSLSISSLAFANTQPVIDGTLDSDYGPALALQQINTDQPNTGPAAAGPANGSELDAGYGVIRGDKLYLMLTGNLATNGANPGANLDLFFDTGVGGSQTLPVMPFYAGLNQLNGQSFGGGFKARGLINIQSVDPTHFDVSYIDLSGANAIRTDLGETVAGAGGMLNGGLNVVGVQAAVNNSYVPNPAVAGDPADPQVVRAVQTGIELAIPLGLLNTSAPASIRVSAVLANSTHTAFSNQVLGGPARFDASFTVSGTGAPTLYVGTGQFSSSYQGGSAIGMLKSTDGGLSFSQIGQNVLGNLDIQKIVTVNDPANPAQPVVLAATWQNGQNGGLYRSTDGGTTWTSFSDGAANHLPKGSVSDLLSVPGPGAGQQTLFAAVLPDGPGPYLDSRNVTYGLTPAQAAAPALPSRPYIQIPFVTTDPAQWATLTGVNVKSFQLTIGNNTATVRPDFAGVIRFNSQANNNSIQEKFQTALDNAFGPGATTVSIIGSPAAGAVIRIQVNDPTQEIGLIQDPVFNNQPRSSISLLATNPLRPGIYKSTDAGATWTLIGPSPPTNDFVQFRANLRNAQRISLAVSNPNGGAPVIDVGVITADPNDSSKQILNGLYVLTNYGNNVRLVMSSPQTGEVAVRTVVTVQATNVANDWRNLDVNPQLRIVLGNDSVGKVDRLVTVNVLSLPAGSTMANVAARIQAALNDPMNFGPSAVTVTWDQATSRFQFKSVLGLEITELSGRGAGVAANIFDNTNDAYFIPGSLQATADLANANRPFTSIQVNDPNPAAWRQLGATRSFAVTIGNDTHDITPDFSTLGAAATMADVAEKIEIALNAAFPALALPIDVAYQDTLKRFVFVGRLGNPVEEVRDITTPSTIVNSLARDMPAYLDSTSFMVTNAVGPVFVSTIQASTADVSAWVHLGATRSFSLTFTGKAPRDITPDFSNARTMDDVATAIQQAIGATFLPPYPIVTVRYDANNQLFRIEAAPPDAAHPSVAVSAIGEPAGGGQSLLHNPVLLLSTLALSKTYYNLNPGGQGNTNFSIVGDPTQSNIVYVGGDRQPTRNRANQSANVAGATDYVGRLFRVDTSPGQSPEDQTQLVGIFASGTGPHADSRTMLFDQNNNLIEADDGGLYYLQNTNNVGVGGTAQWVSLNGNLAISEFSSVTQDPINNILYGGAQDVGSQMQEASNTGTWNSVTGGDGNTTGVAIVRNAAGTPISVYRYMMANTLNTLRRTKYDLNGNLIPSPGTQLLKTNMAADAFSALQKTDKDYDGFTQAGLAVNAINSSRLLVGMLELYESQDLGTTAVWRELPNRNPSNKFITAIAYGGQEGNGNPNSEAAYVAAGNQIWSRRAAGNFINAPVTPPGAGPIQSIVMDPENWKIAYAVDSKHLYLTIDGGQTWQDITGAAHRTGALPANGLSSVAVTKVPTSIGNFPDFRVEYTDGTGFDVNLSGVTTFQGLQNAIRQASMAGGGNPLTVISDGMSLILQPQNHMIRAITPLNGSMAAQDLHLLNAQINAAGTLQTDPIPLADGHLLPTPIFVFDVNLSDFNNGKGVRIGTKLTDVLLVGSVTGVERTLNPLGSPSDSTYPTAAAAPTATWTEFGLGLPNAQVTSIQYTPPETFTPVGGGAQRTFGDTLVVGTRGRGAFTLTNARAYLAVSPGLTILEDDGTAGTNHILLLTPDVSNPNLLLEVLDGRTAGVYQISTIDHINVIGLRGNDTLEVSPDLLLPGGISFDGGGSGNNRLIIVDVNGQAADHPNMVVPPGSGQVVITNPQGVEGKVNYTNTQQVFTQLTNVNNLNRLRNGLQALTLDRALTQALTTRTVPFLGHSLGSVIAGISNAPQPASDPNPDAASSSGDSNAPASADLNIDSQGDTESLFTELLQGGPNGFLVSQIGTQITTSAEFIAALNSLSDSGDSKVTETEDSGVTRYDVTIDRTFTGDANLGVSDGLFSLAGSASFSVEASLHIVFGLDGQGFFLDPSKFQLTLNHIQLLGDLSASGRIGFLGVTVSDARLTVDPNVQVVITMQDPGPDPVTGVDDGLVRPADFAVYSPSSLYAMQVNSAGGGKDVVLQAQFQVAALVPGGDAPFNLGSAGLQLTWADATDPTGIQFTPIPSGNGSILDQVFRNGGFKTTDFFNGLADAADFLDQLTGQNLLTTKLPLVNKSLGDILDANPAPLDLSGSQVTDVTLLGSDGTQDRFSVTVDLGGPDLAQQGIKVGNTVHYLTTTGDTLDGTIESISNTTFTVVYDATLDQTPNQTYPTFEIVRTSSLGDLLRGFLDKLSDPSYSIQFPTLQDLIRGLGAQLGYSPDQVDNLLQVSFDSSTFVLSITPTIQLQPLVYSTQLDLSTRIAGLTFDANADLNITVTPVFHLPIRVDLSADDSLTATRRFFLVDDGTPDLSLTVTANLDNPNFSARMGLLGLRLTKDSTIPNNNGITFGTQFDVTIVDPNDMMDAKGNPVDPGRVTVDKLLDFANIRNAFTYNLTGSLNIPGLVLSPVISGVGLGNLVSLHISIDGNAAGKVTSLQDLKDLSSNLTITGGSDYADFNNLTPGSIVTLLIEIGNALQSIAARLDVPQGLPFVSQTISQIVNFASAVNDFARQLYYNPVIVGTSDMMLPDDGLGEHAAFMLRIEDGDPVYVPLFPTSSQLDEPLDLQIADINMSLAAAGLGTAVRAGRNGDRFTLTTTDPTEGIRLDLSTVQVSAPNPAPDMGRLSDDLSLQVKIGDTTTTIKLKQADTAGNTSLDDLVSQINAALDDAGIGLQVRAVRSGDSLIFAAATSSVSSLTISGAEALGFSTDQGADSNPAATLLGLGTGQAVTANFKFNTIQDCITQLNQLIADNTQDKNFDAHLEYLTTPVKSIQFHFKLNANFQQAVALQFTHGLDIGIGTLDFSADAAASFQASAGLDLTAGIDLSRVGQADPNFGPGKALADLNGGTGVRFLAGLTASNPAPSNGQLSSTSTLKFNIVPLSSTGIATPLPAVSIQINPGDVAADQGPDDLATVLTRKLTDFFTTSADYKTLQASNTSNGITIPLVEVVNQGGFLKLVPNNPLIAQLVIDPTIVQATQALGFLPGQVSNESDLQITLRDGSTFPVTLSGAQTLGNVKDKIEQASGGRVKVDLSDSQNSRLQLIDLTNSDKPGSFKIEAYRSGDTISPAAHDLGIDGGVSPSFVLTYGDTGSTQSTTPAIAANASADAVRSALAQVTPPGAIQQVTGNAGGPYTVVFNANLNQVQQLTGSSSTGMSVNVKTIHQSVPGKKQAAVLTIQVTSVNPVSQGVTFTGSTVNPADLINQFYIQGGKSGITAQASVDAANINMTAALGLFDFGITNGSLHFGVGAGLGLQSLAESDGKIRLSDFARGSLTSLLQPAFTYAGTGSLPVSSDSLNSIIGFPANTPLQINFALNNQARIMPAQGEPTPSPLKNPLSFTIRLTKQDGSTVNVPVTVTPASTTSNPTADQLASSLASSLLSAFRNLPGFTITKAADGSDLPPVTAVVQNNRIALVVRDPQIQSVTVVGSVAGPLGFGTDQASTFGSLNFTPDFSLDVQNFDKYLNAFRNLSPANIVTALRKLVSTIQDSNLKGLNTTLPLLNQTPNDILNYTSGLLSAADNFLQEPDYTILNHLAQQMKALIDPLTGTDAATAALKQALQDFQDAINPDSNFNLVGDNGSGTRGQTGTLSADAPADQVLQALRSTFDSLPLPYTPQPVTIPVGSDLTKNDVVRRPGTQIISSIDKSVSGGVTSTYSFATQSQMQSAGTGLPDNGSFPANADHPAVQLNWTGSHNALLVSGSDSTTYNVPAPAGLYQQFEIYAVSTGGASTLKVALNYSSGSPQVLNNFMVADWDTSKTAPANPDRFTLIGGLNRWQLSPKEQVDKASGAKFAIYGFELHPDSTRSLVSVQIQKIPTTDSATKNSQLVFFGASGSDLVQVPTVTSSQVVSVTGNAGGPYTVTFDAALGAVPLLEGLSGPGMSIDVQETQKGGNGVPEVQQVSIVKSSNLVSVASALSSAIDALPAWTVRSDLRSLDNQVAEQVAGRSDLGTKLGNLIKKQLGLLDTDFTLKLNLLNAASSGFQPAVTVTMTINKQVSADYNLKFRLPDYGFVNFEGNTQVSAAVDGSLTLGFGMNLATLTPYLLKSTQAQVYASLYTPVHVSAGIAGIEAQLNGVLAANDAMPDVFAAQPNRMAVTLTRTLDRPDLLVVLAGDARMLAGVDYTIDTSKAGMPPTIHFTNPQSGTIEIDYPASIHAVVDSSKITADGQGIGGLSFDQIGTIGVGSAFTYSGNGQANLDLQATSKTIASINANLTAKVDFSNPTLTIDVSNLKKQLDALVDTSNLDLHQIITGANVVLNLIQNGLQSDLLQKLPFIGTISDFSGTFIGKLRGFLTDVDQNVLNLQEGISAKVADLRTYVFNHLGQGDSGNPGLNLLDPKIKSADDLIPYINYQFGKPFLFQLPLKGADTIRAPFNLNLASMPLSFAAQGAVDVKWDYQFTLGFAVDLQTGFYFPVNPNIDYTASPFPLANGPAPEFYLQTTVSLDSSTSLAGKLFFLQLTASPGTQPTMFTGQIFVDLISPNNDNKITYSQLVDPSSGPLFNAGIQAEATADLLLQADTSADQSLPSLSTEMTLDWSLGYTVRDHLVGSVLPKVVFKNLTLDLGSFLNSVVDPIFNNVKSYIQPIKPVLDFLNSEVPGLTQVRQQANQAPLTFLDLGLLVAQAAGPAAYNQALAAKRVINLIDGLVMELDKIDQIRDETGGIKIDFGTFTFGGASNSVDLTNPNASALADSAAYQSDFTDPNPKDPNLGDVPAQLQQEASQDPTKAAGANAASDLLKELTGPPTPQGQTGFGLSFPLFKNPSNLFKILTGETADLVVWKIPQLSYSLPFNQKIGPLFGVPLFVNVGVNFTAFLNLTVGFDTRGLARDNNFGDGFYFANNVDLNTHASQPVFGFALGGSVGAELNLAVASAGVEGAIGGRIDFYWIDQDNNGKVYLDDIKTLLRPPQPPANTGDYANLGIFNANGTISAVLRLTYSALLVIDGNIELINQTLFRFPRG